MTIDTQQQLDDACEEMWALCMVENATPEQIARMLELSEAIEDFEKAKYALDKED